LGGYRQYLATHQVARVLTSAAWNVVVPVLAVLVESATNRRNLSQISVDAAWMAVAQVCFVAFVLNAAGLESCLVFRQLAK
jgi:hypothetical protein